MLSKLKSIFFAPLLILNYLIISYRDVSYDDFPNINGVLSIRGKGRLILGSQVKINSSYNSNPVGLGYKTAFHIAPDAIIKIGNRTGISNTLFYSLNKIEVEDNVLIGGGCQLLDNDFHSISYEDRILKGDNNVKSKPIVIKEGAFIGASSIILKGVTIGTRSIVAAGSVVASNIPDNEIWGGNPAKFIRKIEKF